jgi:transmembrane protein 216
MRRSGAQTILSSLPLQVLIYFDGWYSGLYLILNLCIYSYKGSRYYYPKGAIVLEVW